jgi:hypothetical protein
MTIRPTCVLLALALAMALPLAAQDLPPVTPRSVPPPPRIAGMKLGEAKQAVDTFATRMTVEIDWLVQPGQRDQAEDKLEAKLDDIQDLVDQGKIAAAQETLDEFHEMLASTSEKRTTSLVAAALAAVIRSHKAGDEGFGRIPDRATFERLSYQGTDGLIEPHLRGIEYVKFYIDGLDRDKPKLHFMDTHTFRSHRVYMRAAGMSMDLGAGREGARVMLGSLCYRPFLTARDGTRGLAAPPPRPHPAQVPKAVRAAAVRRQVRDRNRIQDHRRRPARNQASAAVGILRTAASPVRGKSVQPLGSGQYP